MARLIFLAPYAAALAFAGLWRLTWAGGFRVAGIACLAAGLAVTFGWLGREAWRGASGKGSR